MASLKTLVRFVSTSLPRTGGAILNKSGAAKGSEGTALLVCDLQEKFRPNIQHFPAIVEVSGRLLKASRLLGLPALVTEMYPQGLGPTVPELGDLTGVPVFAKKKFSMLTEEVVQHLGPDVKRVILCGIEAHVCVQSTALDLIDRGLEVHCIADACSSRTQIDRKFAFKRMAQSGVYITTCESILLNLLCGSDHPQFRQIQKLILTSSADSGLINL